MKRSNNFFILIFTGLVVTAMSCSETITEPTVVEAQEQTQANSDRFSVSDPIGLYNPETEDVTITAPQHQLEIFLAGIANQDLEKGAEPFKLLPESIKIHRASQFISLEFYADNGAEKRPHLIELTENKKGEIFFCTTPKKKI